MDSVEEPSYLGHSIRHPLPTTSFDHADLVCAVRELDLSDSNDEDTGVGDAGHPVEKIANEASVLESAVENPATTSSVEASQVSDLEVGDGTVGISATSPSPNVTPSASASAPTTGAPVITSKTAVGTKSKKAKTAGRVVPSRYMMEAEKPPKSTNQDQTRTQPSPATPQRSKSSQRTAPQRTTPQCSSAKPTPKARTPLSSANVRAQSAASGSAKLRSQPSSTPSSAARGQPTSTPTSIARPDAAGGGDTPKSSNAGQKNEDGGVSQKDFEMIRFMTTRAKRIATLHIEDHRKAYMQQAETVLTATAVAISQICGKKNEKILELFKAQCDSKLISLHYTTKDVVLERSQMDKTKAHLAALEQALLSKGRNLVASDAVELPMSDDATSQMSTVKKLVQKLKSQMVAFREIENALPRRIRDVIKTLAEVLGELDRAAVVTSAQINECARHLSACFSNLVEYVYESRRAIQARAGEE